MTDVLRAREATRSIIATINQRLGRRYFALEHGLSSLPTEALVDLQRLIRDFDQQLTVERKEGRKDAALRGRFP